MTEQEHYSLRWNNHQNHILRAFDALLQTKTLVDVTLVCAETSIRAHKVVLSACSPFFQRVFADTPCKHPVIVLKDFRGWVVQAIVDFMYRGEISVPQERLQILIQAGESLQVRGLVDHPMSEITPTPAASPMDDDFHDASLGSPRHTPQASRYDDIMNELPLRIPSTTTATPTVKLAKSAITSATEPAMIHNLTKTLLPPHNQSKRDRSLTTSPQGPPPPPGTTPTTSTGVPEAPEPCTSPMPRRKQARPRRRSGECGPHDLSNTKPATSPAPTNLSAHNAVACDAKDEEQTVSQEQRDQIDADIRETLQNIKTAADEDRPESSCLGEEDMDQGDDDDEDLLNHSDNDDDLDDLRHNGPDKCDPSIEVPENLCTKGTTGGQSGHSTSNTINNNNSSEHNDNNNRIVLSLKDIRHLNRPMGSSRSDPHDEAVAAMAAAAAAADHPQSSCRPHMSHMDFPHPGHPAFMHGPAPSGNGGGPNGTGSAPNSSSMKRESFESRMGSESPFLEHMDMTLAAAHHHHHSMMQSRMHMDALEREMHKDFTPSSPMSLPSHFNPHDGPPHPPSPLPFPGMSLTSPHHMFGLDSPLGLFPPGMDPAKMYNPLIDMSDPRGMHPDHAHPTPYLKKKGGRPKGQHSAPRGGPPRSWTNAELTDALEHVWNKKMTTSQASRIFGIPYNSLLMYVRGKYGKSLKLEQLRRDCISGPPIELLQMGLHNNNNVKGHHHGDNRNSKNHHRMKDADLGAGGHMRGSSSEPDLLPSPNQMFNPFQHGFYPDFPFPPGLPMNMLNLMPDRHGPGGGSGGALNMSIDEDCKSDQSKQSLDDDYGGADAAAAAAAAAVVAAAQLTPMSSSRSEREHSDRREMMLAANGQD